MKVFAHRGVSMYYPENSRAAFDAALAVGADGLECDLRLTGDGHVVLCHDESLKRLTGVGLRLRDATLLQAREHLALLTLDEFLESYCGHALLDLEVKEAAVFPILQKALSQYPGEFVVTSSHWDHLAQFKQGRAATLVGPVFGTVRRSDAALIADAGFDVLVLRHKSYKPLVRELCALHGWRAMLYTVNDAAEARELAAGGAWAIFSDDPATVMSPRTEAVAG